MTNLRTAAQQALEVLETLQGGCTDHDDGTVEALTVWCPEVIATLKAALEQPNECRWLQDGDEDSNIYMASCNRRYFELEDGAPTDNHMKHCCYCGKPLVEVPIEPEDEHD
jgi:hypothetical protein